MKTRRLPNYQHEDKYNLYTIHGLFAPTNQNIALIIELIFKQYTNHMIILRPNLVLNNRIYGNVIF